VNNVILSSKTTSRAIYFGYWKSFRNETVRDSVSIIQGVTSLHSAWRITISALPQIIFHSGYRYEPAGVICITNCWRLFARAQSIAERGSKRGVVCKPETFRTVFVASVISSSNIEGKYSPEIVIYFRNIHLFMRHTVYCSSYKFFVSNIKFYRPTILSVCNWIKLISHVTLISRLCETDYILNGEALSPASHNTVDVSRMPIWRISLGIANYLGSGACMNR